VLTASLQIGREPFRVLAVGCHSDDIELGCGGTLLALTEQHPNADVAWLVLSAADERAAEARASAAAFLERAATQTVIVEAFRDGYFPYLGPELKDRFEELARQVSPDVIFTHSGSDLHQDHRLVSELTWNTFRSHLILEYEIPKYDADLTAPNLYVPLSREHARRKIDLLLEHFPSQLGKHWFTDDLFGSLMRLRGMEANSPTGLAEGFRCRKLVLAH
jgi:LmbE family N-acetylglucosaminyl deacetylase